LDVSTLKDCGFFEWLRHCTCVVDFNLKEDEREDIRRSERLRAKKLTRFRNKRGSADHLVSVVVAEVPP
jgi:hypothetical protein